jgi:subtilisin family serine protease
MKFKKTFPLMVTLVLLTSMMGVLPAAATGTTQTYVVLYKSQAVPSDASTVIANAGGTLVYSYSSIGVAIARSSNDYFRSNLLRDRRIQGASATTNFATQLEDDLSVADGTETVLDAPVTDSSEPLFGLQWDMRQIHTPEAHAITGGSSSVLVGDLDTGLDFTHPDLAPNYDAANSTDCTSGAPAPLLAGNDQAGHGTHTAGTIAAAANSIGIVGVAPSVKIAGIKAGNDNGYFFPEAVICAFVWAGDHGVDVTNNSYFADPWLFNCRNDATQRAIWLAEQRAIKYAMLKGVTVVASEGNQSEDISHPTQDVTSPDDTTPVTREITNACLVIPVEIPGVIGVTANGANAQTDSNNDPTDYLKSYYSSFGISQADVVAPGGDRRYGINPAAGALNGRVLSTWPSYLGCPASLTVTDPGTGAKYCYLQGTSMAGPHVAGVAALIISQNGGSMAPGAVAAIVSNTADPQPCPTELPTTNPVDGRAYLSFLGVDDGQVQTCQGGPALNSWYGTGQVNALSAVTFTP